MVDNRDTTEPKVSPDQAVKLCDRNFGIGAGWGNICNAGHALAFLVWWQENIKRTSEEHDVVIFLCDMCKDISVTYIEYPCISANHAVGSVSPCALEKYIDAYDFLQYFYFCNFNLSWKPYTAVASSHGDSSFTVLGLLEQLNTTGEVPVYLWYKSNVEINLTAGVLQSGNWPGLIVFSAEQVLHIFVKKQCARTVFGHLGAGVTMNSDISFVHVVLNDGPQSEKWNSSIFRPAPPADLNQCLHLSSGHSIVEWIDDCSVSVKLGWFEQFHLKFPIHKFDHSWIQDGMMLEKKTVLRLPGVDQLESCHLPLCDQMLQLEGPNTTTTLLLMLWEIHQLQRKSRQKAPTIEDIDKIIIAISEQMESVKMLQEAIFSHICAAADFVESELQATNIALKIMLAGYCLKISPNEFYEMLGKAGGASIGLKMWSCSQHKIKCLLDAFEIGKRYVVLAISLEESPHNECKLLEVDFVLGAGRIWFKVQVPMPSIYNVLEELDPTILNALSSKLHKVFKVGPLVLSSSSPKKLLDVYLVRHGCILWFEKQNEESLLKVALYIEASKEFLWVVNTYKEEEDNILMCGNGIRCLAKFIAELENFHGKKSFTIHTGAGLIIPEIQDDGKELHGVRHSTLKSLKFDVKVDMGEPILKAADVPTKLPPNRDQSVVKSSLDVDGSTWNVTCVSMGNPHCVTFGTAQSQELQVDELKLADIGPKFEHHEMFPARTNTGGAAAKETMAVAPCVCLSPRNLAHVSEVAASGVQFQKVIDVFKDLEMIQYEGIEQCEGKRIRHSSWICIGETLACGTGACAVVVAAVLEGRAARRCTVDLPGGPLDIEWSEKDNHIYMTGPAEVVFYGSAPL
ncbi:hypothetical protein H5410_044999 [Solanum commersonii]|uniref:Diaminopimelate epimerase n=1 Tax=Solanum commersonii TaxID=4109 RepID=A0A9J5XAH5_SOLCO|nr:hypothetical protein H5410_044999 [Solanum commersonii]